MVSQYKYDVDMSCASCSNAINKVLTKMPGVDKIDISLASQSVVVDADKEQGATYDAVLDKIKKTGRTVKGGSTVRD